MALFECTIFTCPMHGGTTCCRSCEDFETCEERCENHPEKCDRSICYDFDDDTENDVFADDESED